MQPYLLSIYQPDGPPPPDVDLARVTAKLGRLNADIKAAGAWVFTGGLHAPSTATVLRVRGRRGADHRRPVRRGQGAPRRLHDRRRARPRRARCAGARRLAEATDAADRGPAVRAHGRRLSHGAGGHARGDRACVPRRARPRRGGPGPRLRRHRRRRGRRPGGVRRGRAALAGRRAPAEPGRLDHHDGAPQPAIDRLRREASRADRHAQAALLHARDEPDDEEGAVRDDRLRLIFTCCHPALAAGRAGRAHAAAARRPDARRRSRARSSSPRRRWRSGWSAPRARSATRGSPTACRDDADLPDRLARPCSRVVYLIFNEGHTASVGRPAGARGPVRRGDPARRACSPS